MAYNNAFTAVTGATYTAAQYNTYVRDNFTAIWVGTTAGDINYYTSATAKTRLAIGSAYQLLRSTGSAPAWVAISTVLQNAAIITSQAAGDLLYGSSATALARLGIGASGSYLDSSGTAPQWTKFYRVVTILLNTDIALVAGDDAYRYRVNSVINGWNLAFVASCKKSGTGVMTIQIRNVNTGFDMLTTKLTIDNGELDSISAATPAVIDTAHDDVNTGHQIAIDVDVAGTSTLYAQVELIFAKP